MDLSLTKKMNLFRICFSLRDGKLSVKRVNILYSNGHIIRAQKIFNSYKMLLRTNEKYTSIILAITN